MKISIIGLGEIGSALMHVLSSQNNVVVTGWDKNASKRPEQLTLEKSLVEADLIFVCVPSWNLRGALMSIVPHIQPTVGIIALAKGIEKESHKFVDQLLEEQLPKYHIGVLGGPMLAEEMLANKITSGVIASRSSDLRSQVKTAFQGSTLRIFKSTDIRGTALCGVLKNTYTLGIGIAEGLGLGENAKGALFSQALREMQMIAKQCGGKQDTILGLAGAGDFFATCQSPHSRNRMIGITLATGADGHLESEGFMSLTCLRGLLDITNKNLPLLDCLIKIGHERANPRLLEQVMFDQAKPLLMA